MSQTNTLTEPGYRAALTSSVSPSAADAIRAKMMEGRARISDFAAAVGVSGRTIFSWISQGLPTEYIGRTPYVVVDPGLEWLRSRRKRQVEPRGRGRPRKAA